MLSALALIMLTLVGYSIGGVWVAGKKERKSNLADLIMVFILWSVLFYFRDDLGHWGAVGAGLIGAGILNAIITMNVLSQLSDANETPLDLTGLSMGRQLWERWKAFAQRMGNFQGRLLMGYFYFVIVTPFALLFRLTSDPLESKPPSQNGWRPFTSSSTSLEQSKKQF